MIGEIKDGDWRSELSGKNVVYIATKNSDYLRLKQEISFIQKYAGKCTVIVSGEKSYLKRILYVYKKILFTSFKKYDVVFVGFMAQMIVPIWKWKFGSNKLIVDFFISIFDTLVDDRKKVKSSSLIGRFLHWFDERTIKPADFVVADTKAHGQYFADEFGVDPENIQTMYLEADTTYYHPMEIERPECWKDKFLVLYFGSILPVQGVEVILEAIDRLKDNKQIHFIMIGPINKKYNKIDSDTVTYIDWLEQGELAKYIAYSDLCLAGHFAKNIGKANRTIPGKAYIYKSMEKKIIFGDSSANREVFMDKDDNNYFVEMGNSIALGNAIIRIYEEKGYAK